MWHTHIASRLVAALIVFAVVSFLQPTHLDLAAVGRKAPVGDKSKDNDHADPCKKTKKPKKDKRDRGDKNTLLNDCEPPSSGGVARGDFNGDGIADLAVGVPFEDEDLHGSVGAVNIIYGSSTGLTSAGDQYLTELTFGYAYTSNDRFGAALASGDFNGDGFSDLAIGMPGRDRFLDPDHGEVLLIDGSANGLVTSTARTLSLVAFGGGRAGAALVWGDFNGDSFGDLAVGIPEADNRAYLFPLIDAGEVQVFYGGPNGLAQLGARFTGVVGARFGAPLAAGDFNADGASDLVVGTPFHDIAINDFVRVNDAGSVTLFAGGPKGLTATQLLHQNVASVNGTADEGDLFGFALAVGDFNADLRDDLAVGVPQEDLGAAADTGAVHVFFGGSPFEGQLIDSVNDLFFSQASLGESNEPGDRFGRALAAGKFNGDFRADLAIGSPHEDVGSIIDAGIVSVVYGSSDGLSFTSAQHWHQNVAGIPDSAEEGDAFGRALSAWNYGKSTHADLAIGIPFEDLFSNNTNSQQADAGAVVVIYGTATGLSATGAQLWHQDTGLGGSAASAGDRFGVALY